MRTRIRADIAPVAFLVAMFLFFWLVPAANGFTLSSYGIYSAVQVLAAYGLVAVGVGLTMFVREFDLSVIGLYPLAGVVAVKLGEGSWLAGLVAALAIGALVGLVQGLIMIRMRINSISVTLAGAIILLGIASILTDDGTIAYGNSNVGIQLDAPIATILSWHSIIAIAVFVVLGALMRFTRFGRELLSIGGDPVASRTAGVRVDRYTVAVFVASGTLSACAGALLAFASASASSAVAWAPLLFAATAALVGGVSLAGGRGSAEGILAGALGLSFLQQSFTTMASPIYVSSLVLGGLLAAVSLTTASGLRDAITTWLARRQSPVATAIARHRAEHRFEERGGTTP